MKKNNLIIASLLTISCFVGAMYHPDRGQPGSSGSPQRPLGRTIYTSFFEEGEQEGPKKYIINITLHGGKSHGKQVQVDLNALPENATKSFAQLIKETTSGDFPQKYVLARIRFFDQTTGRVSTKWYDGQQLAKNGLPKTNMFIQSLRFFVIDNPNGTFKELTLGAKPNNALDFLRGFIDAYAVQVSAQRTMKRLKLADALADVAIIYQNNGIKKQDQISFLHAKKLAEEANYLLDTDRSTHTDFGRIVRIKEKLKQVLGY